MGQGEPLRIRFHHSADETVLYVEGDVDLATAPTLEGALDLALPLIHGGEVVVDMAGVEFIDSAGVRALTLAAGRARRCGSTVVVRNPSRMARKVFDILEAGSVLTIEDPLEAPRADSWAPESATREGRLGWTASLVG